MNPAVAERDPEDKVTIDVVTFVRLLELTREDIDSDVKLHYLAQAVIDVSRGGYTVTMDDYNEIMDMLNHHIDKNPAKVEESKQLAEGLISDLVGQFDTINKPYNPTIATGKDAAHLPTQYQAPKPEYEYHSYMPRNISGIDHQSFTQWIESEEDLRRALYDKFQTPVLDLEHCIKLLTEYNMKISDTFTVMFPVEQVYRYREYDREFGNDITQADFEELQRAIAQDGVQKYGILTIIEKGGASYSALLTEGNHRLNIARHLGMTAFPIRFWYTML